MKKLTESLDAKTRKTIERGTWTAIAKLWNGSRPNSRVRRAILAECRRCGYTPSTILREMTAAEEYREQSQLITKLMNALRGDLNKHKREAAKHPRNYGYAGDLGYVKEKLVDALVHLRGIDPADFRGV